jgi:Fe-Mn family superoxide dismutase
MFQLPQLPYAYDALEPYIDAKTMEIHYGKHHGGYVEKLNKAVEPLSKLQSLSVEDLLKDLNQVPAEVRTAVRNNGGGHFNHSLFWKLMKKGGGGKPAGGLATAIDTSFGSFDAFKSSFSQTALGIFGSGWAWLCYKDGKLVIESTPNQDNPLMSGQNRPILGLDVWEHAYYLRYQNRRPEYVEAWWNVINWSQVEENLNQADKLASAVRR